MENMEAIPDVKEIAQHEGMKINLLETAKFKTSSISIFFHNILGMNSVTKNALLPAVMRRGTKSLPRFKDIARRLQEMYGATFDCGVLKKGDIQLIQFYIEFLSDKYIKKDTSLFDESLKLIFDIINEPLIENGGFVNDYLSQEKENLKRLINSRANDKVQYAVDKCFEEMGRDEPYGLYEYGNINDIGEIGPKELYGQYKNMLAAYPASIYITGDNDEKCIKDKSRMFSEIKRSNINEKALPGIVYEKREIREINEKMGVNQAKLSMGYRTNTAPGDEDYYAMLIYNGILGGGVNSKLFKNIREKSSLAYYVFSRMDKFKGLMVISSGIDGKNRKKVQDITNRQVEQMAKGNVSNAEFEDTVKTIETGIKSLKDNHLQIIDFYLGQDIANTRDSFESILEGIKAVNLDDVVRVAGKVELDTIYYLSRE